MTELPQLQLRHPHRQPFTEDGVSLMAEACEIFRKLVRQVLIELEFHLERIGTRRSSCASSAA